MKNIPNLFADRLATIKKWQPDSLGLCNIILTLVLLVLMNQTWVEASFNDQVLVHIVPMEILPDSLIAYIVCLCVISIVANLFRRFIWVDVALLPFLFAAAYACWEYLEKARQAISSMAESVGLDGLSANSTTVYTYAGNDLSIHTNGIWVFIFILGIFMAVWIVTCWIITVVRIFKNKENAVLHVVMGSIGTLLFLFIYLFCASLLNATDGNFVEAIMGIALMGGAGNYAGNFIPMLFVFQIMPTAAMMGFNHALATLFIALVESSKPQAETMTPQARRRRHWCAGIAAAELLVLIVTAVVTFSYIDNKLGGNKTASEQVVDSCADYSEDIYLDSFLGDDDYAPKDLQYGVQDKTYLEAWSSDNEVDSWVVDCIGHDMFVYIIAQQDLDGDGITEAVICQSSGGTAGGVYPSIVWYDCKAGEFKCTYGFEFDSNDSEIAVEQWKGKTTIIEREGIKSIRYVFEDHGLREVERSSGVNAGVLATVSVNDVFGSSDDPEERFFAIDIDGDGVQETLTFYHGSFAWLDYGGKMELREISWTDGRKVAEIDVKAATFEFLDKRSDGKPEILCDRTFLFKWNGSSYE